MNIDQKKAKLAALVVHTGSDTPPKIQVVSTRSLDLSTRIRVLIEQRSSFAVVFGNSHKEVLAWIHD